LSANHLLAGAQSGWHFLILDLHLSDSFAVEIAASLEPVQRYSEVLLATTGTGRG